MCSDIALIKPGYSSVSEAIRSQIPIIAVDFPQSRESKFISNTIQELGIGKIITPNEYFMGKWNEIIPEVLRMKENYKDLPSRFAQNGEIQISTIILDLLEEIM